MTRHTPFDGGSTIPYRTRLRNEIIARLSPLLKSNQAFLAAIVKLPGRLQKFDEESSAVLFAQLLGRAPAIGVAIGDRTVSPNGIGGYRHLALLDVHVYFASNSQRSLNARVEADIVSTGDGVALAPDPLADPGVEVAMQCAEELLIGQQVERPAPNPPAAPSSEQGSGVIRHLELKREEELVTNNQITIWEQTYVVGVSRSIDRTRGVLARLLGIDTTIHPPGAPASPARVDFAHDFEAPP